MLGYVCNLKFKTLCFVIAFHIICYLIFQEILSFINTENVPVLVWWTPFITNDYRIVSCSNNDELYKCLITNNRSNEFDTNIKAYLFYGSRIINHDFPLPRNSNILWAVFHEESPKNYGPFLFNDTQNLFNITSTFSRYSDIPVTLQYLTDLDSIKDTKYYVPINVKNQYLNDISPVLYIQSDCDTPIDRDYFVKELGKHVQIDSYGKCLRNKTLPEILANIDPLDLYNEELLRFISKYKFTIAFENSVCDDYITEKLWRPLIVGSIPIYLGSPSVQDWLPNDNSAILVKNFSNLQNVGQYIQEINENDTLYESFLEHKLQSKVANTLLKSSLLDDHPILAFECKVCENVYNKYNFNKRQQNVYNCPKPVGKRNTWYQHWDVGKCQSKALKLLISKNKPYSSKLFDQTWKHFLSTNNC